MMAVHDLRWVQQPDGKLILEVRDLTANGPGMWFKVPVTKSKDEDFPVPATKESVITISETTFRRLMQDYIAYRTSCRDGDAMLWKSRAGAPSIRISLEQTSQTQESMGYTLDWPKQK